MGELPVNAPAPSDDLPRQLMQMHQLRLENQRLKAVIDCFPLPLSVRDRQSRYTHVSQSWLNLHGFTHDDVIGHTWAQLKGSAISDLVLADEQLLNQVSVTRLERETTSSTVKADTGILHKASLVENNVITGVITTITDISDRKVVERKLSSSEERFRSLASMSADWFWELDESLRFTHVTLGVEAATGQPTSFFIGRRLSEQIGRAHD